MSLAKCPNCGKSCSSLAIDCPHCDRPLGFDKSERDKSKTKPGIVHNGNSNKSFTKEPNSKIIAICIGIIGIVFLLYYYSGQPKKSDLTWANSDVTWVETGHQTVGDGWCCGGVLLIVSAIILPTIIKNNTRK